MYFFELFLLIIFFLFLGTIFNPFVGGCLVLFIILFLVACVMVFFSMHFLWFIFFGCFFYLFGWGIKYYRWYKLPDMQMYLSANPQCKQLQGVSCKYCNSERLEQFGLYNRKSRRRFYSCIVCGNVLYRFTVL